MSRLMGAQLPDDLLTKLTHGDIYRNGGLGLPVLTTDGQDWPHVALSPGAVATDPRVIYFALGGKSGSLQNLQRERRITLLIAAPETLYYVKGYAEIVRREMGIIPQEAAIRLSVTEVLQDSESFVTITGGISYRYNVMHEDSLLIIGALLDELQALSEGK